MVALKNFLNIVPKSEDSSDALAVAMSIQSKYIGKLDNGEYFSKLDQAIANATAWFPPKEDCPNKDEDYYWECHVIGADGDFCWKNADAVPAKTS